MRRARVIVITKDILDDDGNVIDQEVEVWGSLTAACRNHPEFVYDYAKKLKYPFNYKGLKFKRVSYKTNLINGI